MGLSGRKEKQRIHNDPRNLTWADDASRFGQSYLSKFGWDASKGLGVGGEGRTSHIKVAQKLDMMGIGAAHQKDPNGIAWKQNKDFENLLKRLNAGSDTGTVETTTEVVMKEEVVTETNKDCEGLTEKEKRRKEKKEKKDKKKDKKRKHGEDEEDSSEKKKRRKSSEEPSEKKAEDVQMKEATSAPAPAPPVKRMPPRFRAHRARAIAAKTISSKSDAHISEILGIAPTPSTSTPTSEPSSGSATPGDQGKLTVISELEKITTSTKSVADYFKEKLQAKTSNSTSPFTSSDSTTPASTPGLGSRSRDNDYDDEVRPMGGLGFSRLRLEVKEECDVVQEATMRMGLSKFSSLMSSTFLTQSLTNFDDPQKKEEAKVEELAGDDDSSSSEEEETKEERKRRRKEEKEKKRAAKEEKRAKGEKDLSAKKEKKEKRDKKDKKSKKAKDE
ncbi:hypothetical protein DFP72DRAFT_98448 [Ephemerocybe angulata]|uniref:PinX1-related protein 1 n=1 Tax=Ephemerocybe angulata TaxID=980116 RepID=A0A8H6I769_9AGAR|nr:hypothetical protein DFP72DRAFT_98448 [Tulosesus angulatus]